MSFVFAEKLGDVVFVFSDTYWERPILGKSKSWHSEPLVKLVLVRERFAIAYAGDVDVAKDALTKVHASDKIEPKDILLAAHLESIRNHRATDFVLVDKADMSLTQFVHGTLSDVNVSHLGSHSAFESFQKHRLERERQQEDAATKFDLLGLPNTIGEDSFKKFSHRFRAFKDVLFDANRDPNSDWGGFPVFVIATPDGISYGEFFQNSRSPIESYEIPRFGIVDARFNDEQNSAYALSFSGSSRGFAAHFVFGSLGFLYSGFDRNGLEAEKFYPVNPYEFRFRAEAIGCCGLVRAASITNHTIQFFSFLGSRDFPSATKLLNEIVLDLKNSLNLKNPQQSFDFSAGVLRAIESDIGLIVSFSDIAVIGLVLEMQYELSRHSPDRDSERGALRDLMAWRGRLGGDSLTMTFQF